MSDIDLISIANYAEIERLNSLMSKYYNAEEANNKILEIMTKHKKNLKKIGIKKHIDTFVGVKMINGGHGAALDDDTKKTGD